MKGSYKVDNPAEGSSNNWELVHPQIRAIVQRPFFLLIKF